MNKDSDEEIIIQFERMMFNLKHHIENIEKYDNKIFIIHNTFDKIKTYLNNQIFINKFQLQERINFISAKVNILYFDDLNFLEEKDKEEIWSMIIGSLIYVMIFSEYNEQYEIENNICEFIKLNFDGDLTNEIDKMKKDKTIIF